jgi:hypothetical protein
MFEASAHLHLPFDPVTLSYVMALRGVRPRLPREEFIYAELGCGTAERLILLAASNPEGTFFGFDADMDKLARAAATAEELKVANVTFSQANAAMLKDAVAKNVIGAKCFDYLVYNEADGKNSEMLADLHDVATLLLRANGAFAYRYRTYSDAQAQDVLFADLTRATLTEQPNGGEALAKEWRGLCQLYLSEKPALAAGFDTALAQGKGFAFLHDHAAKNTRVSRTLEVGHALSGKELTFLGSAHLPANYMELSTPEIAHAPLGARRLHPLYEAMKDMAMNVAERVDIWGHEPLQRSDNLITLFGAFTFGTMQSADQIARTVNFQGKSISFIGPLYDGILSLASVMPVTIGDLVHADVLQGIDQVTLLNTMQLLVACGVLQPMRASFDGGVDMSNPKLVGPYNQSLRRAFVDLEDYAFASSVTGRAIFLPPTNTLVLQALDRGGMDGIAVSLAGELMRLAPHPALAPLGLADPQRALDESVRQIETVFHDSMMRWFSLGLLRSEAA